MNSLKKFIPAVALFLLSCTPAFAWHCNAGSHWVQKSGQTNVEVGSCVPDAPPPTSTPGSTSSSTANSSSVSNSNSSATSKSSSSSNANQSQKQNQSQVAQGGNATATNGGQQNAQNLTVDNKQVRQAPAAFAPDAYPSAPCRVSGSVGASAPIGGISLGGSKLDSECDKRETARAFANIGQYQAALEILCTAKSAKVVKNCANLPAPVLKSDPAPVPQAPFDPVTINLVAPPDPVVPAPVQQTALLIDLGSFKLVGGKLTNVGKRYLDDAALRLENNPTSKLMLTGPIEATQAVAYLRSKVSPSRFELHFADEQNSTIFLQLWTIQEVK